jgi:hypothetical protein
LKKRLNILNSRIITAKQIFIKFGADDLISECDSILEELQTIIQLFLKNPDKAKIRLEEIIERSENVFEYIVKDDIVKHKKFVKEQEEIREYHRLQEVEKYNNYIDKINKIINKE